MREERPIKTILAAGRLVDSVKRFSLLIRAFARLAQSFPDWRLVVCGDGPDRPKLQAQVEELHIADAVSFPGFVEEMDRMYAESNIFCHPSKCEGFGLVLTEAQRHALPTVGFAHCSGVNEIIVHGENGLLAEGESHVSLAASLRLLMTDGDRRRSMGLRGQELLARYNETTVYDAWEKLFETTANAKGKTKLSMPPLTEEERAKHALQEILCREMPFTRPLDEEYGRLFMRHLQRSSGQE